MRWYFTLVTPKEFHVRKLKRKTLLVANCLQKNVHSHNFLFILTWYVLQF